MMRKPLCKAKEVKTGKCVEGWYVPSHEVTDKDGNDVYAHILVESKDKTTDWVNVFANTVCEYTGCDDQYGAKIFVNDRVADEHGMTYDVIFDDEGYSFMAKYFDTDSGYNYESLEGINWTLVGNEFDAD